MPRNQREYLLRYAEQVDNDFDRALEKLQQLKAIYETEHSDYAQYIELVAIQVLAAQEHLRMLRTRFM